MADDLTGLEIAVLCDLLDGPGANLKAYKRAVLDQLVAKGRVEPVKGVPAKFQLSDKAHHLLAERGVGISRVKSRPGCHLPLLVFANSIFCPVLQLMI